MFLFFTSVFFLVVMTVICCSCFFFFKQKTAYEMRISDWSSDVCSSDLRLSGSEPAVLNGIKRLGGDILPQAAAQAFWDSLRDQTHPFFLSRPLWRVAVPPQTAPLQEIGRASCRERVCQYV